MNLKGQEYDKGDSLNESSFQKEFSGRLNFLGLLDGLDQNVSIGGEYLFNPHWSAGLDIGYIFSSEYLSENRQGSGVIIRPFVRYYPGDSRIFFWQGEIHYKYVRYKLTDWLGKDMVNGFPSYEELTTFNYIKKVYGFHIKAGRSYNLSTNKKLKLELYIGLGYRWKNQGSEEGSYFRSRTFMSNIYEPRFNSLVVPMGARLVYKFIGK